jgi:phosphoesterase RecJ-like protein
MQNSIKSLGNRYKKEYKLINHYIKKYNKICIFRHVSPDFDAYGSQLGLYNYIKDKYPLKDVHVVGEDHPELSKTIFPKMDVLEDSWFNDKFLAIIVDVSDKNRISDQRFEKAECIVKIDHHPNNNNFANVNITNTNACAAAEIISNMLYNFEHMTYIGYNAAKNLYIGIVGDSGRFLYSSTSAHTFQIANKLIQEGLILPEIYSSMYARDIKSLEITKRILNNYKLSPQGVAYYVLTNDDLTELQLDQVSGKDYVNTFSNIIGIDIWASITQDVEKNCFWISLRSKGIPVNGVASKYQGGGHSQASGCRINTLDELPNLINDLDNLIINSKKG